MSLMSLMSPRLSPAVELGTQRAQGTSLGLTAAAPAAAPAGSSADAAAATGGVQATLGADGVQPTPPQPMKTILGSVLRGAVTGASLVFSVNKFAPAFLLKLLHFIPPFKNVVVIGTVAALVGGAVVGGVLGLLGGIRKTKAQAAEFMKAQEAAAAQQAQAAPVGDPLVVGPDGRPVAIDPSTNMPVAPGSDRARSNPVMGPGYRGTSKARRKGKARAGAQAGASAGAAGCSCGCCKGGVSKAGRKYSIKSGDTLGAIARRYGTTVSAIADANKGKISDVNLIYAGDSIRVPGKRRAKD